jgi:hypothetical protein
MQLAQLVDPLELQHRRARKLGCVIHLLDPDDIDPALDRGPYLLKHGAYPVWCHGLPLIGLASAISCYERELKLPMNKRGDAWASFGEGWA